MAAQATPWPAIRASLFLCLGLMNTVWIRPEDLYSFKHYVGFVLLVFGLVEGGMLIARGIRRVRSRRFHDRS